MARQRMTEVFTCFGYGSLVNRQKLPADAQSVRVQVHGWRRAWRLAVGRSGRPRCTLTVIPDPAGAILGTVIAQPKHHETALHEREAHYQRRALDESTVDWLDDRPAEWPDPFIHVGISEHHRRGGKGHPVLLSYVDTVIAGFQHEFGEDGPRHFAETTLDWHVPVLNDRKAPHYSRAISLPDEELAKVDDLLAGLGVTVIEE